VHAVGTATFRERRHYAFVQELALAAAAALTYFGVRNLTAGAAAEAMSNAERLARLESRAHIAWERSLQDALLDHDLLVTLANWVYIWGHWPVIVTAAIVLYRKRHDRYLLLRNTIFVSGAIGFLFFALLPVAPPRLADPSLLDTVTLHSDAYRALQPPGLTNQYAAFPSLHFGWNLVVGIAVWGATRNVPLRVLSILGPAAMGAAVVLTANHYLLDLVGGTLVVLVALWAVRPGSGLLRPLAWVRDVRCRPPRRQQPGAPAGRRATRCGADRGGHPPLAGAAGGAPPEDGRPAADPLGQVAARESVRSAAPAA